ncbi:glycosyltransferase [Puniceicoccaceae bacterium]|nr:glycosyltransferase [Puniceicoccaceae bacterium]
MTSFTVQHISSAPFNGGAARAGYRIHQGLLQNQQQTHWIQTRDLAPESAHVTNWTKPKRKKKLFSPRKNKNGSHLRKAFKGTQTCATSPESWGNAELFLSHAQPDLYNFHWMGEFLDWPSTLPTLTQSTPIVWTLHDINPLQGAWHYDPFEDEINDERNKWDAYAHQLKQKVLQAIAPERLTFVGPSRWMVDQCRQSELTKHFDCIHIPSGLDTNRFSPIDKATAKAALGIAPTTQVIGFIADSVTDPRKGIHLLNQALQQMKNAAPLLLTVGSHAATPPSTTHQINLGSIQDDRFLRIFYSACDLFICPSLQDNLPNTVMEAMACQTPVVAFDIGGLSDMVRPDISGYLLPNQDTHQLSTAITHALSTPNELQRLGAGARALVMSEFDQKLQATRYAKFYQSILNASRDQT